MRKVRYGMLLFDEPKRDTSKKIIHIDMDAFYASVEIREDPKLKGKPVIIARHPKESGGRGVVTTASYEARKYGVHSAMPAQKAYELCPEGIFIPARFDLYREVSAQVREIFTRYTDIIEPLSLDEAYLDVTENKMDMKSGTLIARKIQKEVWEKVHLTCSAGVSYNKFIAKVASDFKKPAGITVISPDDAHGFLMALPIEKFYGVGEKTVERMHEMDVHTGADLYKKNEIELIRTFGKMGLSLYKKVRGIDDAPVSPARDRKSVGKENTFGDVLESEDEVMQELRRLSSEVMISLSKKQMHGKTVVLKVRHEDFETRTKRKTYPYYIKDDVQLFTAAADIWDEMREMDKKVRLLGITITGLDPLLYENIELPLWE